MSVFMFVHLNRGFTQVGRLAAALAAVVPDHGPRHCRRGRGEQVVRKGRVAAFLGCRFAAATLFLIRQKSVVGLRPGEHMILAKPKWHCPK